uniref:Single stranded DNA binding protein 4 n=1 Tax=Paramormyrops kingsleyae TaxID=1676925 RepID=A0A3B3SCN5_9TELE
MSHRRPKDMWRLALYVYEYLLHIGAQKSAQTFLSEIRWEKNITLGEPPGFLHSWWCVFWDLYCAAPERRDTCEHSSEAKAFHDYSAAAAPSPVLGSIPPNDGTPGGQMPPGYFQGPPGSQASPHAQAPPHPNPNSMMGPHGQPFMSPRYAGGPRPPIRMGSQPPGGVPGGQPLLPSSMDHTRQQGHPNLGGPMQRMTAPRGMAPMGPGPQGYVGGVRPPLNSMGPGMPVMNMAPGTGRPWPNPTSANSIPYSSSSPGSYVGPPGGGAPPGTPIMPSPADSTNSSDNLYTMITSGGGRPSVSPGGGSVHSGGGLPMSFSVFIQYTVYDSKPSPLVSPSVSPPPTPSISPSLFSSFSLSPSLSLPPSLSLSLPLSPYLLSLPLSLSLPSLLSPHSLLLPPSLCLPPSLSPSLSFPLPVSLSLSPYVSLSLPPSLPPSFTVPHGPQHGRPHGANEQHGAPPHERVAR